MLNLITLVYYILFEGSEKMKKYYCHYYPNILKFREIILDKKHIVCEFNEGDYKSIKFNKDFEFYNQLGLELGVYTRTELKVGLKEYLRKFSLSFGDVSLKQMESCDFFLFSPIFNKNVSDASLIVQSEVENYRLNNMEYIMDREKVIRERNEKIKQIMS